MAERVWLIERTRISTDYQHVTAYSPEAALEIANSEPPHKWLIKRGLTDDPNATYAISPVQTADE